MFQAERRTTLLDGAFTFFTLTFHNAVRSIRSSHRDAMIAILYNILQTLIMVGAFYLLFEILGMRGLAIRGDFLLYVMSGIFVFMTHVKSAGAVMGADGPTSPMMKHLPMNQGISVRAAALGALYTQTISMVAILGAYHLLWNPISFQNPFGTAMMLIAWFSGCALGLCLLAMKPWFPKFTQILHQIYSRINMFASGKMFVANQLPAHLVAMFAWNPLFHIIDLGRGYMFVNYNPMKSSMTYPIVVSLILLVIGVLGIYFTGKQASASWEAAR